MDKDSPKWHLETRKIKDLKPFHKNPRSLSKDQFEHLKNSLSKFGMIDKPIINKDNVIIGGHQRIQVLKKMGQKEVECYVSENDLSPRDIEELNIRLNRNSGEWDYDKLANEFDLDDLCAWGFNSKEFATLSDDFLSETFEDKKTESCKKCPECGQKIKRKNGS